MSTADEAALVALKECPECSGEITFGFGLAGGGDENGNPSVYWLCLDCDWMSPRPNKTVCFHHTNDPLDKPLVND